MENKNIMLEEQVFIKTKPSVLDMDRISILEGKLSKGDIGGIVFNLECIRILLTNNTNPEIIDQVLNSDFDEDMMDRISSWFEKLDKALFDIEESKKKSSESSIVTKTSEKSPVKEKPEKST